MAIQLEFIDFIIPIKTIKKKYPGGWEQCLKDHEDLIGRVIWYDDHLFRTGAMNPMDIRCLIEEWGKLGFHTHAGGNNPTKWIDVCVVEFVFGGVTLPCDWIEVVGDIAYLKDTSKGKLIGRENFSKKGSTNKINALWYSNSECDWEDALERYWDYVRQENMQLERSLNELKLKQIAALDPIGWYQFLHDKYFRWKYTAPNRYATTTKNLKKYIESNELDKLFEIKNVLLDLDVSDIRSGLSTANEIHGLGIPGASGLLSLMYPRAFATVDQFVIKTLRGVSGLPENEVLKRMNPNSITLENGIVLISLMRRKAAENNSTFGNDHWTPRKIDMVLWGTR
ncbi:MAG: hypothetical protein CVU43_05520 [Chloroflexi bacterium HGW-Chloroflexi-5]|jgi:hypothetical protein|nr:MAG: hypothetical protein CVU43_05520 [Chloroflexi bacterium HGW-Chloroflexi-5]